MKYLGIDYGSKNVGIAISSEDFNMSFPVAVFKNDKDLIKNIDELCKKEGVGSVVLGESRDFEGKPNPIMKKITAFKKKLEQNLNLKVFFELEFFTTQEAQHIQGKGDKIDASAATIILQSFLDKNKDKLV